MGTQLAIVTGASSGIGYNLAKVFAENGFDLVIGSNGDRLEQAEADFKALGVEVTAVQSDLASFDGIDEFWKTVAASGRKVDAAALNVGVGLGGSFQQTDLQAEIKMIRLNVEGTTHLAKHVVQHMVANRAGKILFTASLASEMVAPGEAVYAATKAFILSLSKSLAAELKDTGVTVTALQPGPVDTDFFHRADMDNTQVGQEGKKESEPYDVAKQGFKALIAGDQHVYAASLKTKLEGAVVGLVPDSIIASMHEKMVRPTDQ